MIDETDVAHLMRTEIESTEAPPTRLSVQRAMTVGRRQRRGRTGGVVLAVVGLVVGIAVLPGVLAPGDRPERSADWASADPSRIPAALETVDPMIRYVRFGWLPSGLESVRYRAGEDGPEGPAVLLSANVGSGWQGVAVDLYLRGVTPAAPLSPAGTAKGVTPSATVAAPETAAPDIRGGPATFVDYGEAGREQLALRWRYAPDGWAEVRVVPWSGAPDPRDVAVRVAQTLRFSTTDPTPLPGRVDGLPNEARLKVVTVSEPLGGTGRWHASIEYVSVPGVQVPSRGNLLRIDFSPYAGWGDGVDPTGRLAPPNSTVDGHHAYFGGPGSFETLAVYDVSGMTILLDGWDRFLGDQGARGLFGRLDLVDDPARWRPGLMD